MDEASRCDRIALIQHGKILAIDTPSKVIEGFSRKLFSAKAPEKYRLINALRQFPATITAYPFRRFSACNIYRRHLRSGVVCSSQKQWCH